MSPNAFILKSYLNEQLHHFAVSRYDYYFKKFNKENQDIDVGFADFSCYYFQLKTQLSITVKELNRIKIKYKIHNNHTLIDVLLEDTLVADVLAHIKLFL